MIVSRLLSPKVAPAVERVVVMRRVVMSVASAVALFLVGAFGCSSSDDGDGSGADGTSANGSGNGTGSVVDGTAGSGDGSGASDQPVRDLVPVTDVVEGGAEALRQSACVGEAVETEQVPVVLQLIVDVSGSMNVIAPGSTDTKWNVTRAALLTSLDGLRYDSSVGVTFYPNMATTVNLEAPAPVETCIDTSDNVEIAMISEPDSAHRAAIAAAFEGAEANDMAGTPTHDAYDIALEGLLATPAPGNKFILLITDGQPTFSQGCLGTGATLYPVDPQPILDAVAAAAGQGVKTFVIGSPGSEANETTGDDARPWLSEAARLGGTAPADCSDTGPNYCHFDMTQHADFGAALTDALLAITQTLMCNYNIIQPPEGLELDLSNVNVIYTTTDGMEYLVVQNGADDCELGWQLVPETGQVIVCGSTCDKLQADPTGRVELLLGCLPVMPIVE